jgi:epoxyqueuosine reductase
LGVKFYPTNQTFIKTNMFSSVMDRFVDELFVRLREHGYQARMVSISRLQLLQKEIDSLRNHGLLDSEFYQHRLGWFSFQVPENLPKAQSLIVAAVPRPQTRAIFTWNGQRRPLILPPTYTAYDGITEQVENLLAKMLREKGYTSTGTALPLKLLAVRSGLGQYGRNNICYVSGMGSFLQLVAIYSDVPCEEDGWQETTMMKSCEECELCRRACPTGAISSDRFLLRAERCIVYHNEKKSDVPFPNWMDTSWHNCVVGCMHCQRVCPQNKEVIQWTGEEEEFSEEETALLLEGVPHDKLAGTTLRKLERLSLVDYLDSLPRNLGVFFNKIQ